LKAMSYPMSSPHPFGKLRGGIISLPQGEKEVSRLAAEAGVKKLKENR
jgi:hypothetical protein